MNCPVVTSQELKKENEVLKKQIKLLLKQLNTAYENSHKIHTAKQDFHNSVSTASTILSNVFKDIWPGEELESFDIFLQKGKDRVGLHAMGHKWDDCYDGEKMVKAGHQMADTWGNEYDENFEMIGRGSFRVFGDIEETAKDMEQDGWIRIDGPKK